MSNDEINQINERLDSLFEKVDAGNKSLNEIKTDVTMIRTSMFGVEGMGGCRKEHSRMREELEELKGFKLKILGAAGVVGALASYVWSYIFSGK